MVKYESLLKKTKIYESFKADKLNNSLNHCYLILTDDKLAREGLCRLCAKIALCPDGGCDKCSICEKINDGAYVSLKVNENENVSVADVEAIIEDSYFTSFDGDMKVYVISNVQGMNERAQNKILKTLEEPPENVVFILGATQPSSVLKTILSRCKKLYFDGFKTGDIYDALTEQYGGQDSEKNEAIVMSAVCGFGNLYRAEKLLSDEDFYQKFSLLVSVLRNLSSTKKLDEQLGRLNVDKDNVKGYLDITETIFRLLLDSKNSKEERRFKEIDSLAEGYDNASLVNILELIIKCKKMSESNCNPLAIADLLFMGILEVKYLCRR